MTAAPADPPVPLSTLLREGSQAEHRSAEAEPFLRVLMAGELSAEGYLAFLLRLVAVYGALESVGERLAEDPVAGPLVDPALHRTDALTADVAHWWAASGRSPAALDVDASVAEMVRCSPATRAYVARVQASETWGGLYAAHHYTRYLGDLSGGQAMGRVLARSFGLRDGDGVRFFSFDAVPRPKPYKDAYRAALDALPVEDAGRETILAEVRLAFELNAALFRELGSTPRHRDG